MDTWSEEDDAMDTTDSRAAPTAPKEDCRIVVMEGCAGCHHLLQQHHPSRPRSPAALEDDEPRPAIPSPGAVKAIQIITHLNPDDLKQSFNVLMQEKLRFEKTEDVALCISSDASSDIQVSFCICPAAAGCKAVYVLHDLEAETLCVLRLSVNVFGLHLVRPTLRAVPLRRKIVPEDGLKLPPQGTANVTLISDTKDEALVQLDVDRVPWNTTEPSVDGTRGLFCVLAARIPGFYDETGRARFGFGDLRHASDPDIALSKLIFADNCTYVYLSRERANNRGGRCRRNNSNNDGGGSGGDDDDGGDDDTDDDARGVKTPLPPSLTLRLRLHNLPQPGPYFSALGSPYLAASTEDPEHCVSLTAPYNFSAAPSVPHILKIFRKFYGQYAGIFVPQRIPGVHMTSAIWRPRSWLEIIITSETTVTIRRKQVLGKVFFVPLRGDLDHRNGHRFWEDVRSKLVRSRGVDLAVLLGMATPLKELPTILVGEAAAGETESTTIAMIS